MFTPLNVKKLTNVSIVTLKKFGKRYELAIYPNKLYEYQKGITTNLNEILLSNTIYKNVSKGEICSKEDLKKFNTNNEDIIKYILDFGKEQKNEITREKETSMTEKEIIDLIKKKVMKNNKFMNYNELKDLINKVHNIKPGNSKKQSQEIIFKLEKEGIERVKYKVEIKGREVGGNECSREVGGKVGKDKEGKVGKDKEDKEEDIPTIHDFLYSHLQNILIENNTVYINTLDFPKFRKLCKERNISYVVKQMEEEEEEEII
jgi:ribosome maturation protein SDO1